MVNCSPLFFFYLFLENRPSFRVFLKHRYLFCIQNIIQIFTTMQSLISLACPNHIINFMKLSSTNSNFFLLLSLDFHELWHSVTSICLFTKVKQQIGYVNTGFSLFEVLRRFQHCTGHITTGSWKGRGNQYIEFARVVYCKLPTNGKQLPAFPLEPMRGSNPGLRGGRRECYHSATEAPC